MFLYFIVTVGRFVYIYIVNDIGLFLHYLDTDPWTLMRRVWKFCLGKIITSARKFNSDFSVKKNLILNN